MWVKSSKSAQGECVEAQWIKSSHSGALNCVEARVEFVKSTRSGAAGHCVEAGECSCGDVQVRDSKHRDAGHLTFERAAWQAFVDGVKAGEFPA